MSLILAGIVVAITLGIAVVTFNSHAMSDAPYQSIAPFWWTTLKLIIGFGIAFVIAATHWVHIPW